jgi:putative endonuclease
MTRISSKKPASAEHRTDQPSFYCYIVQCTDGSYYTGWSTDPKNREKRHNCGQGARYTRTRRPVTLVYIEPQPDRSTAMKREASIKNMTRQRKQKLIEQGQGVSEDA